MDTYNKRQKEMRRQERQREKAAKRIENKARKAAGLSAEPEHDTEANPGAPAPNPSTELQP